MIISNLDYKILDPISSEEGIKLLKKIEYIGRVSHRSEERVTEDSYDRFLRTQVLNHGDFSITEHAIATVELELDRGLSHEWVRHRIGAYTQESTRFVNYGKQGDIRVIAPPLKDNDEGYHDWLDFVCESEKTYLKMLERGESPQIARSVLPTCLATKLVVTYNLRAWRHFFIMRTSKETHPQMKTVTIPLLEEFQQLIPILYEDIIPETKQSISMSLLQ